jgi:hypothetical protein
VIPLCIAESVTKISFTGGSILIGFSANEIGLNYWLQEVHAYFMEQNKLYSFKILS